MAYSTKNCGAKRGSGDVSRLDVTGCGEQAALKRLFAFY